MAIKAMRCLERALNQSLANMKKSKMKEKIGMAIWDLLTSQLTPKFMKMLKDKGHPRRITGWVFQKPFQFLLGVQLILICSSSFLGLSAWSKSVTKFLGLLIFPKHGGGDKPGCFDPTPCPYPYLWLFTRPKHDFQTFRPSRGQNINHQEWITDSTPDPCS